MARSLIFNGSRGLVSGREMKQIKVCDILGRKTGEISGNLLFHRVGHTWGSRTLVWTKMISTSRSLNFERFLALVFELFVKR